jgi:hypothetical protein
MDLHLLFILLIWIIVGGVVIYLIRLLPLPSPWDQIAMAIVALIFLLILVNRFLMPLI